MDYQISWMAEAITDLESAVRHAAERNPEFADALRIDLLKSVEILPQFPAIGPRYARDPSGRVREIVCRGYRIFYRIRLPEQMVEVLTLRHSFRNEPRLPV